MNWYKQEDEQIVKFLKHLNNSIDYWSKVENISEKEKISGVIFSFLVMIDGGGNVFPSGLDLIDRETGKDISNGYLHEILHDYANVSNQN